MILTVPEEHPVAKLVSSWNPSHFAYSNLRETPGLGLEVQDFGCQEQLFFSSENDYLVFLFDLYTKSKSLWLGAAPTCGFFCSCVSIIHGQVVKCRS